MPDKKVTKLEPKKPEVAPAKPKDKYSIIQDAVAREISAFEEKEKQEFADFVLQLITKHTHKAEDVKDLKEKGFVTKADTEKLLEKRIQPLEEYIESFSDDAQNNIKVSDNLFKSLTRKATELKQKYDDLSKNISSIKIPADLSGEVAEIKQGMQVIYDLIEQLPEDFDAEAFEEQLFGKIRESLEGSQKVVYMEGAYTANILQRLTDVYIDFDNPIDLTGLPILGYDASIQRWRNGTVSGGGGGFTTVPENDDFNITHADNFSRFLITGVAPIDIDISGLQADDEFILVNHADQLITLNLDAGMTIYITPTNISTSGGTVTNNKKGSVLRIWVISPTELQVTAGVIGAWSTT